MKEICWDGTVHSIWPGGKCCGKDVYHPLVYSQKCVDGKVVRRLSVLPLGKRRDYSEYDDPE